MVSSRLTTSIEVSGMNTTDRSPTRRMSPGRLPNQDRSPNRAASPARIAEDCSPVACHWGRFCEQIDYEADHQVLAAWGALGDEQRESG